MLLNSILPCSILYLMMNRITLLIVRFILWNSSSLEDLIFAKLAKIFLLSENYISILPDFRVSNKFSFIFYIFVKNYFTKNCLYEAFFEESIFILVISLVLPASCPLSSYFVGVFREKSLVRIEEGLLEEFYIMLCFLTRSPSRSTFLPLMVSSFVIGYLNIRFELFWWLFFSRLAFEGNLFDDWDLVLIVIAAFALEMEGKTIFMGAA